MCSITWHSPFFEYKQPRRLVLRSGRIDFHESGKLGNAHIAATSVNVSARVHIFIQQHTTHCASATVKQKNTLTCSHVNVIKFSYIREGVLMYSAAVLLSLHCKEFSPMFYQFN